VLVVGKLRSSGSGTIIADIGPLHVKLLMQALGNTNESMQKRQNLTVLRQKRLTQRPGLSDNPDTDNPDPDQAMDSSKTVNEIDGEWDEVTSLCFDAS
jgi:hypothetical protein